MQAPFDLEQHKAYTYHFYFAHGLFENIIHIRNYLAAVDEYLAGKLESEKKREEDNFDLYDPRFNAENQFGDIYPQILFKSCFLHSYFFLEVSLNEICSNIQLAESFADTLNETEGTGIKRAARYLKKITGIKRPFNDKTWNCLLEIHDIRNIFVHADGYTPIDKTAIRKFANRHPGLDVMESEFERGFDIVSISKEFTTHVIDNIERFFDKLYQEILTWDKIPPK